MRLPVPVRRHVSTWHQLPVTTIHRQARPTWQLEPALRLDPYP